jgi:outer membrane protein TolC
LSLTIKITQKKAMKMRFSILFAGLVSLLFLSSTSTWAQDTLRIDLSEFLERGLQASGQVAYEHRSVDLADNRADMARSQRFLPRVELNSQHGVIPGVRQRPGSEPLPEGRLYLDPSLENDWEDWAIFTRAELSAIQPVYSWGAVKSAIGAAEAGARAAEFQFDAVKAEAELQLYELYYSYLLALEVSRIMEEADREIDQVERTLQQMKDDGDPDLKESDVFKFEILKTEFEVQKVEVEQSLEYVKRIWNYALQADESTIYIPEENFLDAVAFELQDYQYYEQLAMQGRPELRGVESGIDAMRKSVDAARAQQYPMVFLGISGSFAHTPNRPRQTNPFIINNTNYASGALGLGIRQNLNFSSMRNSVERAEIEYRRVNDLHKAVTDGIVLDLNERYRDAVVADTRVTQKRQALSTARNWVRNEQLNYDIGFGDIEDLLESVQKELELRIELKQNIFDLNKKVAALYKAGGISIHQLTLN